MGHLPKQNSSYMHPNSVLGSTWEAPIVLGKFIGEMASGSGCSAASLQKWAASRIEGQEHHAH